MSAQRTKVLVYTDGGQGASLVCVAMVTDSLQRVLTGGPFLVEQTSCNELVTSDWMGTCKLLVMPGGRDLPYVKQLAGKGNDNIRQFVSQGGSYLGLCAGAYYACERVEFAVGDPDMEVVGPRELAFFPGVARGPVFPGFDYGTNAGARAASIRLESAGAKIVQTEYPQHRAVSTGDSLSVYFNGGCTFLPSKDAQFDVLATYSQADDEDTLTESSSAIVLCECGRGKVVLSGAHFEVCTEMLQSSYHGDEYIGPLLCDFEKFDCQREQLFSSVIKYLLQ